MPHFYLEIALQGVLQASVGVVLVADPTREHHVLWAGANDEGECVYESGRSCGRGCVGHATILHLTVMSICALLALKMLQSATMYISSAGKGIGRIKT